MPQPIITRLFLEIKKHEFQVTMLGTVNSTDLQCTVSETSPPNIIEKKSCTCNPKKLAAANRQKRCSWKPRNTSFRLQRGRLRRRNLIAGISTRNSQFLSESTEYRRKLSATISEFEASKEKSCNCSPKRHATASHHNIVPGNTETRVSGYRVLQILLQGTVSETSPPEISSSRRRNFVVGIVPAGKTTESEVLQKLVVVLVRGPAAVRLHGSRPRLLQLLALRLGGLHMLPELLVALIRVFHGSPNPMLREFHHYSKHV